MSIQAIVEALDDGMNADEWYQRCQFINDRRVFLCRVAALKREGRIIKRDGVYFHPDPVAQPATPGEKPLILAPTLEQQLVDDAIEELKARLENIYRVDQLDLKVHTLRRLALLMDTTIADVLEDVALDLEEIQQRVRRNQEARPS